MGWRFRRRLTLFPGVKINFSKSGISTTFGVPGASINVGRQGAYLNTGIPGTGIYNRTKLDFGRNVPENDSPSDLSNPNIPNYFLPDEIGAIKSGDNNTITSKGLLGIKETLLEAYKEKKILQSEVEDGGKALTHAEKRLDRIKLIPFHRFLFKRILEERQKEFDECKISLNEAKEQFRECKVAIEIQLDSSIATYYDTLLKAFNNLQSSQYCWNVTTSVQIDRVKERSYASQSISRQRTSIKKSALEFVESEHSAFHFININGADLFFYPAFLIAFRSKTDFALIDYNDLIIDYIGVNFVETETIPNDTAVISKTWKYINKDGPRDRRFSNNYEIPIVSYGELHLKSNAGLNEAYLFSNASYAQQFADCFLNFKQAASNK